MSLTDYRLDARRLRSPSIASLTALALALACNGACNGKLASDAARDDDEQPLSAQAAAQGVAAPAATFGDPLAGLSAAQLARFQDGRDAFAEVEDVADGLGPVFNGTSCGGCHAYPAFGGASAIVETRFGVYAGDSFDPLASMGGSLIQSFGIGPVTVGGQTCNFVGEVVPAAATTSAGRLTTPLFGLGLVDAVPDSTLLALAAAEGKSTPATSGRAAIVSNLATGTTAVGRFGWKAQVPTLFQFAGDAYLNEMGVTNPLFPAESCPQGNCALLACDPVADPEDDGTDVQLFTDFMTFLAPPAAATSVSSAAGESAFGATGCGSCHTPRLRTGPSAVAALDSKNFFPYSDFLLHDMGALGDTIAQGAASGSEMRTAPLWGARVRTRFLHDGRASTVRAAIVAHDGQGAAARDAFLALTPQRQAALLDFIQTL